MAALAGCSRKTDSAAAPEPAPPPPFKIGVMTGTVSQAEEDFRAGEQVERRYPGRVMHVTHPDNFVAEIETVMAQLAGLAADPAVRVIIVGQAIPGSATAASRIRTTRPDILIGFVGPYEAPDSVSAACDIAILPDSSARGVTMAETARQVDMVAILAIAGLLVDAAEAKADFRDSLTVRKYLEAETGTPVRLRRHDAQGNQWLVLLSRATN